MGLRCLDIVFHQVPKSTTRNGSTFFWSWIWFQREKLGTFGRVPEIYTNLYHQYMYYIMVV